jgi:hypothetical protein
MLRRTLILWYVLYTRAKCDENHGQPSERGVRTARPCLYHVCTPLGKVWEYHVDTPTPLLMPLALTIAIRLSPYTQGDGDKIVSMWQPRTNAMPTFNTPTYELGVSEFRK